MGHILSHPVTSKHMSRHGNKYFRVGSSDMQGYRVNMEDAYVCTLSLDPQKHPNLAVFGVFDGHSGYAAAKYCAEQLPVRLAALDNPMDPEALRECVQKMDLDFMRDENLRSHGCTCCFAVIKPDEAGENYDIVVANVGDSRCILVTADGSIRFVTEDHKPDDEGEAKRIRAAGGSVSFGRVDGELAMSRSIGDWNYKCSSDLPPNSQKVIADPDVSTHRLSKNDYLIICCDGLVERLNNEQVTQFVQDELHDTESNNGGVEKSDLAQVCSRLLEHSLIKGSKDNMSALIVQLRDGTEFNTGNDFLAGPFQEGAEDKKFVEAYVIDAKRAGIEGPRLMQLAQEAERQREQEAQKTHRPQRAIQLPP